MNPGHAARARLGANPEGGEVAAAAGAARMEEISSGDILGDQQPVGAAHRRQRRIRLRHGRGGQRRQQSRRDHAPAPPHSRLSSAPPGPVRPTLSGRRSFSGMVTRPSDAPAGSNPSIDSVIAVSLRQSKLLLMISVTMPLSEGLAATARIVARTVPPSRATLAGSMP